MVYLDNSATTPLCVAARAAMIEAMDCYGNPSSLHAVGQAAHKVMETARMQVAAALGLRGMLAPGSLVFTAGGSEADA